MRRDRPPSGDPHAQRRSDRALAWAKQYQAPIEHYEWFLDAIKHKMIFKLYVREHFPAPRVVP